MFRGICRPPVSVVDKIRPIGTELFQLQLWSWSIWTHKIETKVKYIRISNILHLLSAPDSVPHAASVLAWLVVESKAFHKFSVDRNLSLIVLL